MQGQRAEPRGMRSMGGDSRPRVSTGLGGSGGRRMHVCFRIQRYVMVEARGQEALFVASFAIAVPCMALGGLVEAVL